jgi:hypothetical protein
VVDSSAEPIRLRSRHGGQAGAGSNYIQPAFARDEGGQSVDETTRFSANLLSMKATPLEPEIVTRKGKPVSVILPIKKYAELLERVEDAEDIAWLRKARQKPLSYRPLEEYVSEREKKRRV